MYYTITYYSNTLCFTFSGLITACSLLGSAAASLGGKGQALVDFCEASTHVVIVVIRWFLW